MDTRQQTPPTFEDTQASTIEAVRAAIRGADRSIDLFVEQQVVRFHNPGDEYERALPGRGVTITIKIDGGSDCGNVGEVPAGTFGQDPERLRLVTERPKEPAAATSPRLVEARTGEATAEEGM